jgi:hypothetical protein
MITIIIAFFIFSHLHHLKKRSPFYPNYIYNFLKLKLSLF